MNQLLLDQVQRALQAQEDTIQRQQQMLDDKDQDIAELTDSLTRLALAQTQETKRLPMLMEQLQNKIDEQVNIQSGWLKHRAIYMNSIKQLVDESVKLCSTQIQLVESMKEYQSAIMPQESLNASTGQLKGKLNDLRKAQIELENSQTKIISSQSGIEAEVTELDKLLTKLEK